MSDPRVGEPIDPDVALGRFGEEVLRWNRSINLVSRRDAESRVGDLMAESRQAWAVLTASGDAIRERWPALASLEHWHYLDLGSGAGFPGLVWSILFERASGDFPSPGSLRLVEPRGKRGDFLERQIRLARLSRTTVLRDAWGSKLTPPPLSRVPRAGLITMKALALDDERIVRGWQRYLSGAVAGVLETHLLIVRFIRPGADQDEDALQLPLPGREAVLSLTCHEVPSSNRPE